jgi:CO/xanthine dehydrogenase Mo-binding subunit
MVSYSLRRGIQLDETVTESYGFVGSSRPRQEGPAKASGYTRYAEAMEPAGTLHARLVTSPFAHARVRAVHTEAAKAMPGVVAVMTGKELADSHLLAVDEVIYAGMPVAVVVAESDALAEDAAEAVEVDWEPLPAVTSVEEAMKPGAPRVRMDSQKEEHVDAGQHGAVSAGSSVKERPANVGEIKVLTQGDVVRGFRDADAVVEATYHLPRLYQGFLETHITLAVPGPEDFTVYSSTQGQFGIQGQVARLLGLPREKVRVVATTVGGGFGGKFSLLEPVTALLAYRLNRPVKLWLDRMQDFQLTHSAPGSVIRVKIGGKKDGTLTALEVESWFECGVDPDAPLDLVHVLMGGTYRIPHLQMTGYAVLTNQMPSGAYRGPGAPQASVALEGAMDLLAGKLGWDPLELRLKNASREGDPQPGGGEWPRIGLVECLEAIQSHRIWQGRHEVGPDEAVALAVGGWPGGLEPAAASCQVDHEGIVTVRVGAVDITGSLTAMANIAAEVLGIRPEHIRVVSDDTSRAPYAGGSGGSKTIYTVGKAVESAAREVRAQILAVAADQLEASVEDLTIQDGEVMVRGVPSRTIAVSEIAKSGMRWASPYPPLFGHGRSAVNKESPAFTVHAAKVRVDRETGVVKVLDYVAAQDVGRAINPKEVEGQILGGIAQGLGRALLERLAFDGDTGQLLSQSFMDYLLPTTHDMPPTEVLMVEVPSPYGPFGAKGVGEPPAIPGAAAVLNAVSQVLGKPVTRVPITPDAVLATQ